MKKFILDSDRDLAKEVFAMVNSLFQGIYFNS